MEFGRRRRPKFVVAGYHNIPESPGSLFVGGGLHSSLWALGMRFNKSDMISVGLLVYQYAAAQGIRVMHTGTSSMHGSTRELH